MATYSEALLAIGDIAAVLRAERNRMAQGRNSYVTAASVLAAMPTTFGTILAAINAAPAGAPYDDLKASRTALIAEFTALQSDADAIVAAIDAV